MKIVFDSEAELEKYIHDKFLEDGSCCIDDSSPQYLERQLTIGVYGIADLVSFDFFDYEDHKSVDITVYELKKEKITSDAFVQVARYATGLKQFIESTDKKILVTVSCALVGTEIDESCFLLNDTEIKYFKVHFNPACGVDFKEESSGWHRSVQPIKTISDMIFDNFVTKPVEAAK